MKFEPKNPAIAKRCKRCGKLKLRDMFYFSFEAKDRLRSYCKQCDKEYNAEYHKTPAGIEAQERAIEVQRLKKLREYGGFGI